MSPPFISKSHIPAALLSSIPWHPTLPSTPSFLRDKGKGPQCQRSSLSSSEGWRFVISAKITFESLNVAAWAIAADTAPCISVSQATGMSSSKRSEFERHGTIPNISPSAVQHWIAKAVIPSLAPIFFIASLSDAIFWSLSSSISIFRLSFIYETVRDTKFQIALVFGGKVNTYIFVALPEFAKDPGHHI